MAASPRTQQQKSQQQPISSSSYENVKPMVDYIFNQSGITPPKIGIICGSGLSGLAETVVDPIIIDYSDIPNFPTCTVEGHLGRLVFGKIENVPVALMQGRFHFYEGYSVEKCSMPVRFFFLLGAEFLLVSNAAGSINPLYKAGDLMIIRDHLNLMGMAGSSPLRGTNDTNFGPRHPALVDTYCQQIMDKARSVVNDMQISKTVHEGIYACVAGPQYETVAEMKLLQTLGADAVGMSTVPEVVMAKHCDMKIFGFSLITNEGTMKYIKEEMRSHETSLNVAREAQPLCQEFVRRLIREIAKDFPVVCTCFN